MLVLGRGTALICATCSRVTFSRIGRGLVSHLVRMTAGSKSGGKLSMQHSEPFWYWAAVSPFEPNWALSTTGFLARLTTHHASRSSHTIRENSVNLEAAARTG